MDRKKELKKNDIGEVTLGEILDKMIKLQDGNKSPSFLKKTICILGGLCVFMFAGLICVSIYKNSFTTESILATLLAFFSIFISIFFYFKADETSTKFYDSSYKFMKEISVTLGKIEERFGEKLNSLNDKVSHLDTLSKEATEEIEDKKEDKDEIINKLMERAHLNEDEKEKFRQEIEAKESEIEFLKKNKFRAEREAAMLRRKIDESREVVPDITDIVDARTAMTLLTENETPELSVRMFNQLKKFGYIDSKGNVNRGRIAREINKHIS